MATIQIQPSGESSEVKDNARLRQLAAPLGTGMGCHSGICGTCVVRIVEGGENLKATDATEERTLARVNAPEGARLLCKAELISSTVVVEKYNRNADAFAQLCGPRPAVEEAPSAGH